DGSCRKNLELFPTKTSDPSPSSRGAPKAPAGIHNHRLRTALAASAARPSSRSGHEHLDWLRHDRGGVRHMALVAEQELQRVYSQWQRHSCFRLPGAEVQMIEVIRDRLVERGQLGIDQEMVMAGIGLFDACWRYAHIDQTK